MREIEADGFITREVDLIVEGKKMSERDCANCVRYTKDGCSSWGCKYINREEAIKAWEEKHNEQNDKR